MTDDFFGSGRSDDDLHKPHCFTLFTSHDLNELPGRCGHRVLLGMLRRRDVGRKHNG